METLATYFSKLAKLEGTPPADLISFWKADDVKSINDAFSAALEKCDFNLSVDAGISVQALGIRIEDAFAEEVNRHLTEYALRDCIGQGYPDRRLERLGDECSFAFEVKAKTQLDPKNSQREVLTSGTKKLRRNFPPGKPIYHLFVTVLYSRFLCGQKYQILVEKVNFEFLEPSTPVLAQFQAAVSQRLLSRGTHHSWLFIPGESQIPARKTQIIELPSVVKIPATTPFVASYCHNIVGPL